MTNTHRSIDKLLDAKQAPGLGELMRHLRLLEQLALPLYEALPPLFQGKCQLVNYRQGRLIVSLSNQALTARFRFAVPELLQRLRTQACFAGLIGIDFYVAKPTIGATPSTSKSLPRHLRTQTASQLLAQTEGIEDPTLRSAWLSLVKAAR